LHELIEISGMVRHGVPQGDVFPPASVHISSNRRHLKLFV
jgi:hypothetical protein